MAIYALGEVRPEIDPDAFVHPDAIVIGDVVIGSEASVWPTTVLRGDFGRIEVGARTSVQDGTVVHAGAEYPTILGRECVVGHNAYLEGCVLHDACLIGSMATVLPRATVGRHAIVAAGAVVMAGAEVPADAMALGIPARIIPDGAAGRGPNPGVTWEAAAQRYVDNAARYARELRRVDTARAQPDGDGTGRR